MKDTLNYGAVNCPRCKGRSGQDIPMYGYWNEYKHINGAPNFLYHSECCNCTPREVSRETANQWEHEAAEECRRLYRELGHGEYWRRIWINRLIESAENLGDMESNAERNMELVAYLRGDKWQKALDLFLFWGCPKLMARS